MKPLLIIFKPQILAPKIEEFPCLVHKLFVILTTLQYKPQVKYIQAAGYNGARTVYEVSAFQIILTFYDPLQGTLVEVVHTLLTYKLHTTSKN